MKAGPPQAADPAIQPGSHIAPVARDRGCGALGVRGAMKAYTQRRLNTTSALLFMLASLAIALLVGIQGRQEGKGWLVCVLLGATAGVLGSYCGVLCIMVVVAGVRG